ncbi:MAG: hypothetical protein FWE95_00500 [Planctomycetaceae bacterium]|nr:hypothetical protein [Planctomycetaceae bacterium]
MIRLHYDTDLPDIQWVLRKHENLLPPPTKIDRTGCRPTGCRWRNGWCVEASAHTLVATL